MLPAFSDNEIGLMETSSGAIRVAWFDGSTLGVSVPDDTKLFTLSLQIIGEAGTNSNITISNSPIVIEVTSSDGTQLDSLGVTGGTVTIPGDITSSTFFAAPNGMELYQNEPNPFYTVTRIKAMLPTSHEVQFFITDVSGKIVYQNNFKSVQGENTIEIKSCLLYTSPSPRDATLSRMPSSA